MSLRRRTASSLKWAGLSHTATSTLQLLQRIVLARLLVPGDFGLAGITLVATGFAQCFADFGISKAIIQRQDATRRQLSSLYWLNVGAGVLVYVLFILANSSIADFFGEAQLQQLLPWAAVSFVISPFGQQYQVLLEKRLSFRTLTYIEVAAGITGAALAIGSALAGQGVFALIWGHLAATTSRAVSLVGMGWSRWRPTLHFDRRDLAGYLGFGLFQMGQGSVGHLARNIHYIMIGRYLGAETLGVYWLAYQLVILPLTKMNQVISRVAFPVFAMVQKDPFAVRRGFLEASKLIAFTIFPVLIGLAATAPVLVPVLYGAGWEEAIPLVQILVPLGLAGALAAPFAAVLLARGRADMIFYWFLMVAVSNTCVFWFVVDNGVFSIALANTALGFAHLAIRTALLPRVAGVSPTEYAVELLPSTIMVVVTGVVVHTVSLRISGLWDKQLGLLMCLAVLGGLVYFALAWLFQREYLRGAWRLLVARGTDR